MNQGSVCLALQRLIPDGWIIYAWETTENIRCARYCGLTCTQTESSRLEVHAWRWYTGAVEWVVEATRL